ncbi:MAG: 4-hydroxy-tetrahydrodipicolinate reductase [Ruminococcaceae bacterium]|nr:4-hydroxy-tetrahydrodipicolinate reductase [Oscillospiraceae bacterium]
MTKIILIGCNGRMGKTISGILTNSDKAVITAGVDICDEQNYGYHVYTSINSIEEPDGVIVDFSHHTMTKSILEYAKKNNVPCVICSTGHTEDEIKEIENASKLIPVFKSANMSLGINLLVLLAKKAASVLEASFDIEIIEKHHNQKLDAPSGTALLIADAIKDSVSYDAEYCYDRHTKREKRSKAEIGIHSVRGGTIVGEHEVIFAGQDEIVSLSHRADSRTVFAEGAIQAACYLDDKKSGLYNMDMLLTDKIK